MHIDHITRLHLRMPLVAPFETSFGRITEREGILIVVQAEGLTGYGECVADHDPGYAYETALTAWHILADFLAPAILRRKVADPADFQRRVAQVRGHPMAKAGLEMALWDLQGKREGKSLAELLGGTRTRVDVGVSLQPLDDLGLLLIEQPLSEDDLWDHRLIQARFRTPICLDESILSVRHARQALEMESCRVINIKAGRVGGLSEAVAIHDLCHAQGVPVWCGGMLETGVGRASNLALASLPGFTLPGDISASDRYYAEDITQERFTLNPDSTIDVPAGPGLGVTLDPAAVDRYTVAREQREIER